MKKFITGLLISTFIPVFITFNQSTANTPPATYISVIANVQIQGAVKKPGIYKVPAGTRLVDVLIRAGGLKKDAVTSAINLTLPVTDGSTFYISSKKELEIKPEIVYLREPKNKQPEKKERKSSKRKKAKKQDNLVSLVNINTATPEELNSLPGIGEHLAQEIIGYRTKHGRFKDLNELNNVPGIGDKKLGKLKKKIIL